MKTVSSQSFPLVHSDHIWWCVCGVKSVDFWPSAIKDYTCDRFINERSLTIASVQWLQLDSRPLVSNNKILDKIINSSQQQKFLDQHKQWAIFRGTEWGVQCVVIYRFCTRQMHSFKDRVHHQPVMKQEYYILKGVPETGFSAKKRTASTTK